MRPWLITFIVFVFNTYFVPKYLRTSLLLRASLTFLLLDFWQLVIRFSLELEVRTVCGCNQFRLW